jgi:hypothetical protein
MISIFLKPSKITVDCFTTIPELVTLFPVVNSNNLLPDFWKTLPNTIEHNNRTVPTMKTCPGANGLYKQGFIMPAWTDITIDTNQNKLTWFPDSIAATHPSQQWGDKGFSDYYHIKLYSPWAIKEKSGVKFLLTNTFWHDSTFKPRIVNGLIEFKYQHHSNINMFVPKLITPKIIKIPAGKELAQFIPLSDKRVDLKFHVINDNEMNAVYNPFRFTDIGWYYKRKKILQSLEK